MKDNWKQYEGKMVRLVMDDIPYPRPKDGMFVASDNTHVFLLVAKEALAKPFLKSKIIRVDIRKPQEQEEIYDTRPKA